MKQRLRKPETISSLSEWTLHQVNSYALAAGAAGVGLLALAPQAEARIVFHSVNKKIVQNGGLIYFDLNQDGIPDFGLSNRYVSTSQGFAFLRVKQHQPANEIWQVISQGRLCAAALPAGKKIGPTGNFHTDPKKGLAMAFADFEGTTYGPWLHKRQAYLGLKFVFNKTTHFGWARIKLSPTGRLAINATLTGYAYETVPNRPIIAGQTSSPDHTAGHPAASALNVLAPRPVPLGVLALGADGAALWRRKKSAVAADVLLG